VRFAAGRATSGWQATCRRWGFTAAFSELDRIPVAAGLDALRTVRSGFGPGLEARDW